MVSNRGRTGGAAVVIVVLAVLNAASAAAAGTVAVTPSTNLNPAGQNVNVQGAGFNASQGVYVQYCVQPTGALGTAAGRATRCNPDQHAPNTYWVHSSTFGSADEAPMNADGSFAVSLAARPSFTTTGGEAVDCTVTPCGVFTRRDHDGGSTDYSQDTFTPVQFGDGSTPPPPPPPLDPCPGGLLRPVVRALYALLGLGADPLCSVP